MYLATSIPRGVLAGVWDGARSALLEPLAQYRWRVEREPDRISPEATDLVFSQLCRLAALMHLLGARDDELSDRLLDIEDYGPALCEALSEALRAATVDLKDAPRHERRRVVESVLPLCAFAEIVEAACLDLAGAEPAVHVLQEGVQVLLVELERGGPASAAPASRRRPRSAFGGRARTGSRERCVQTR